MCVGNFCILDPLRLLLGISSEIWYKQVMFIVSDLRMWENSYRSGNNIWRVYPVASSFQSQVPFGLWPICNFYYNVYLNLGGG